MLRIKIGMKRTRSDDSISDVEEEPDAKRLRMDTDEDECEPITLSFNDGPYESCLTCTNEIMDDHYLCFDCYADFALTMSVSSNR
jgi:hypothetical protein